MRMESIFVILNKKINKHISQNAELYNPVLSTFSAILSIFLRL